MDSRQQFEEWYTTYERNRKANGWMPLENHIVRHMRESWQASRESLVVSMPESQTHTGTGYIETVRHFIEQQGILTK